MIQMRADLEISLTRRSFAFPLPALFTSFDLLRMCVVLCKPGFAPSSIYTADNLGSPQVEPTSKPWRDLTLGDRGLGRLHLQTWGIKYTITGHAPDSYVQAYGVLGVIPPQMCMKVQKNCRDPRNLAFIGKLDQIVARISFITLVKVGSSNSQLMVGYIYTSS